MPDHPQILTDDDRAAIVAATKTLTTMADAFNGFTARAQGGLQQVVAITERIKSKRKRGPDNIEPDKPLPLEMAARVAFPDGSMTASGLRNEIKKGNLQASKVAGRIWTTLSNIKRMMERCQITEADDAARVRNSTSANPSDPAASSDGSSSTAPPAASASREAQAHLSQIVQRLRKPSPPTSPKSTSPTSGKVVPIKS
jgi:hypothetical protein